MRAIRFLMSCAVSHRSTARWALSQNSGVFPNKRASRRAISVLTARERNLARQFLHDGETLKNWCIDVQRRHYQRLNPNDGRALEISTYFLDMFNALRRISGHLNSIGHTVVLARTT